MEAPPPNLSVHNLSDKELFEKLRKDYGYACGPIVPSTRKLYEKKLIDLSENAASNVYNSSSSSSVSNQTPTPERTPNLTSNVTSNITPSLTPSLTPSITPNTTLHTTPTTTPSKIFSRPAFRKTTHGSSTPKSSKISQHELSDPVPDVEWTAHSVVGIFVVFFSIIAAFYLYSRVKFNLWENVGLMIWRTGEVTAFIAILIAVGLAIIKYISHKKKRDNEDKAAVQDLIKKSIELLQSPDEPQSMPVINIRNTLLSPRQSEDPRWVKIWSNVVDYIENNEYHIKSAIEEINGEEFKTWKWCGMVTIRDRSTKRFHSNQLFND